MSRESYDLFISYPSSALHYALDLHSRLVAEGFSVWFDKRRLLPVCKWHEEIEAGCEASRVMLPVLTPNWKASNWCRYETYGSEHVIPLLCEDAWEEVSTPPLRGWQFVDLRRPDEATWQSLFAAIRAQLAQPMPERKQRLALLPVAHCPHFVGREELLLELHERLHRTPTAALTQSRVQAVSGMGGVGKTTLARAYAEKFWRVYRHVLWVTAEDRTVLVARLAQLALDLRLIRQRTNDIDDARRLLRELNSSTPRLLILDNAADEQSIQEFLPTSGGCRTIITSRFAGWSPAIEKIDVNVLGAEPACELLVRSSGAPRTAANCVAAARVAEALGYLPLALEQAAAYVREERIGFGRYLDYYADLDSRRDLLARTVLGSTQYPFSLARTWLIGMQRVDKLARAALVLSAFFSPASIPRSLLYAAGGQLAKVLERTADGPGLMDTQSYTLDTALGQLSRYSLISQLGDDSYALHRLVQRVVLDHLGESRRRRWAIRAVTTLDKAFPTLEFENWARCDELLPHAFAGAALVAQLGIVTAESGNLLNRTGGYLFARGQYAKAAAVLQHAVQIRAQVLGDTHADYAESLHNLGSAYIEQRDYVRAEPLLRQALEIVRRCEGEENSSFANTLNSLAALYWRQRNWAAAEPLLWQALEIVRRTKGEQHHSFGLALNNLAGLYHSKGNYAAAEALSKQAIEVWRNSRGERHPDYFTAVGNLAMVYKMQGNYAAAEALYRHCISLVCDVLGDHDPYLATLSSNLAVLLRHLGREQEATKYETIAAAIRAEQDA